MTGLVRVKGWIYRMQIRLSQLDFPNLCLISTSFLCKAEKGLWFYLSSLIYIIWIHPYIRSVISVFSNVIQRSILASLQRHLTLSTISKCFCQNPLCVCHETKTIKLLSTSMRVGLWVVQKKKVWNLVASIVLPQLILTVFDAELYCWSLLDRKTLRLYCKQPQQIVLWNNLRSGLMV